MACAIGACRWQARRGCRGVGSVGATVAGALLLGLVFNILNFENGRGVFSLSAYWRLVIRGGFLLVVILLQSRIAQAGKKAAG